MARSIWGLGSGWVFLLRLKVLDEKMGSAGMSDSVEGRRDGSALAGSLNDFFLERKRFILVVMCLLVFAESS